MSYTHYPLFFLSLICALALIVGVLGLLLLLYGELNNEEEARN